MGSKQSITFRELAETHMKAFLIYVNAKRANDMISAMEAESILELNVNQCKCELNKRIPGAGLVIGSRFMASMKAELLLLDNPTAAITELQSCHESMVTALNMVFGQKEKWKSLWALQLQTMINYLIDSSQQNNDLCVQSASSLGNAFDLLVGSKINRE